MPLAAYDPSDPVQQKFLSALALGESGGNYSVGTGGTDLSNAPTDQFGFPQWSGQGSSHAAGAFQFQPGTWDSIASEYNLNFSHPADQNAAAWILAEKTYTAKTGYSLEESLKAGDYTSVQDALSGVWSSVTGNQAAPAGLANSLALGKGASLVGGAVASGADGGKAAPGAAWLGTIEQFFVRFGLIILGGLIVIAALWSLLSSQGVVPSPGQTAKALGTALTL